MGGPWSYTHVDVVVVLVESDDIHSEAISCTQLEAVTVGHSGLMLLDCSGDVQVGRDEAVSAIVGKLVGEQLELSRALSIGEE